MRVAVVSDIHSNLVALDTVLEDVGPIDAVWQLGDVVGYGPDPDGVVARLREIDAIGVRGNHDAAALGGPEIRWFNPEAAAAAEWTRDRISGETRAWLDALPLRHHEGRATLVHGSPRDPLREYIVDDDVALANLELLTTPYAFHGHTHLPVAFIADSPGIAIVVPHHGTTLVLDDRPTLLNPGSVGQPRDGDPRASYLVLDTEAWTVTWRRVAYDFATVQRAIRSAGLPRRLADRLAIGA